MPTRETLAAYFSRYGHGQPVSQHVAAYRIEGSAAPAVFPHIRRDFYKIKLLCGAQGILSYSDQQLAVQADALVFVNPLLPHSWVRTAGQETGFACLFTEEFVTQQLKTASVAGSPLFRVGANPVLFPPPPVVERLRHIFEQLLTTLHSAYPHKHDLARTYVQLLLHEALQLAPTAACHAPGTAAARLSERFLDLLDQQLPLLSPAHPLPLRNANEFARQLAVHPNHLNKALKEITGKSTTAHIAAKLLAEAQSLLRHSNWSLTEIAYCLGFDYTTNFHNFFKRHTGQSPHHYRRQPLPIS